MSIYNLNYNDYNANLCDGLQSILASSEMSDVTLAVEGKYFRAHQVILSMFSTYFRELFHATPSRNTIFFMKNVKHRIMHNLLSFMYEGKVQIPSEDLQMFVDTANELKIKGLVNDTDQAAGQKDQFEVKLGLSQIDSERDTKPKASKANMHKRSASNNVPIQISSELSVLPCIPSNCQPHRRNIEEEDVDTEKPRGANLGGRIDFSEIGSLTIHAIDNEIIVLDDDDEDEVTMETTQEIQGLIISKAISLQVKTREIVNDELQEVQSVEDYAETKMLLGNIDCSDSFIDNTLELDDVDNKVDSTNSVTNDLLMPFSHELPTFPDDKELVTVFLCFSKSTQKLKGVIWDDFRYYSKIDRGRYSSWNCTSYANEKCRAKMMMSEDGYICLAKPHSHGKRRIVMHPLINVVSRNFCPISYMSFQKYLPTRLHKVEPY